MGGIKVCRTSRFTDCRTMTPIFSGVVGGRLELCPGALWRRAGTTHGQPVHPQRGLADADRNVLTLLAAGAYALVELKVVAHHADPGQDIRTIADQGRALERRSQLAVLDGVGLAG